MRRQSLLSRLYHFTWSYKMTPPGKVMTGLIGLTSLGTVSTQVPVFQICCVLLGLLVAAELVGMIFKPNLAVSVSWPASIAVGDVVDVPVRVSNNSKFRSAYDIMLMIVDCPSQIAHRNADQFVGKLRPGETAEIRLQVEGLLRGRAKIHAIDAHSTFPFNLIRIPGGRSGSHDVLVVPMGPPLVSFEIPVDEAIASGQHVLSGAAGESIEYLGNREYAPGEPVRRLDFRAWARIGKPVVREYQDEHASRVGLIVDTLRVPYRPSLWAFQHQTIEPTEEAISLTASIVETVMRDDFQFAFLATACDIFGYSDETSLHQREEILERLALTISANVPVYAQMEQSLAIEVEKCAAVIVVLAAWDEPRQQLLESLALTGHPIKAILVTDEASDQTRLEFESDDRLIVSSDAIRNEELAAL